MAKPRVVFICNECGKEHSKWAGRCSECGEWNTLEERVIDPNHNTGAFGFGRQARGATLLAGTNVPQKISDIAGNEYQRVPLALPEFTRVLGGGVVPGSLILVGGDPGIGKCQSANSRLIDPVSGAYLSIAEWEKQQRPVLAVDQHLRLRPAASTHFHNQGVKPVVKVTTKLGRELVCTDNHPLLTPEGWQPVSELTSGSYIAAPRALPYFGNERMADAEVKLIAYILSDGSAQSSISVTAAIPEVVEDLYTVTDFFGMLVRVYPKEGNKATQYRFVSNVEERKEYRHAIAQNLSVLTRQNGMNRQQWADRLSISYQKMRAWQSGKTLPTVQELEQIADVAGVPSNQVVPDFLAKATFKTPVALFLEGVNLRYTKANNKFIPDCIFTLPRDQMVLLLKTLFSCDGSVYVNARGQSGISYSTISKRLAEDVQHLLLRFGLIAKLRTKPMTVAGEPYTAYEVQLLGLPNVKAFLAEIGIMGRHEAKAKIEQMELPTGPSTHRDVIPTGQHFWQHFRTVTQGASFKAISRQVGLRIKNRRHERPLTRYLVTAIADAYEDPYLSALAHGDVYWDEIVSIEAAGEEPVYDITVPEYANFVANDLIVHNSTLLGQVSGLLADAVGPVLYISGEESAHQIKLRMDRLGVINQPVYLLSETNLDVAIEHINTMRPKAIIVDSIQTVYLPDLTSSAGSVSQVRECAARLMQLAKGENIPIFLVGHVTKEGAIAGPRVLEHIVDTVLYLEGDRYNTFRLLRAQKNRFGSTNEVGVFEMVESGLIEVANPSEAFLSEHNTGATGTAIAVLMEGTRPILAEVQSLVTTTAFSQPRRTSNGIDLNRIHLLLAVLGKRLGVPLHTQDVFVNIVGGLKINEPAADLAIAAALASSYREQAVPRTMALIGEIGLGGELRAVSQLEKRLNEAAKLGFTHCVVPRSTRRPVQVEGIESIPVRTLVEALHVILKKVE